MSFSKWSRRFAKIIFAAVAVVLALIALLVTVARVSLHYIDVLQPEISALIERETGLKIEISDLHGSWWGADPAFRLSGLKISRQGRADEALNLGEVELELDLLASLRKRTFVPTALSVENLVVRLIEQEDGSWQPSLAVGEQTIEPVQPDANASAIDRIEKIVTLIGDGSYRLGNIDLVWRYLDGEQASWRLPAIYLDKNGSQVRLSSRVLDASQLARDRRDDADGPAELMALELFIDNAPGAASAASLYLRWLNANAFRPAFSIMAESAPVSIDSMQGRGEIWLSYDAAEARFEASAKLDLKQIGLNASFGEAAGYLISDPGGVAVINAQLDSGPGRRLTDLFRGNSAPGILNWRLAADELTGSWRGMPLLTQRLKAEGESASSYFALSADSVNLELLNAAAIVSGRLDAETTTDLGQYNLAGRLNSLQIQSDAGTPFTLRGLLQGASVEAAFGGPAVDRFDAYVEAGIDGGHVTFSGQNFSLAFPELFSGPWLPEFAQGRIEWFINETSKQFRGTQIVMEAPNLKRGAMAGEFDFFNPDDVSEPETLQLAIDIDQAEAALIEDFLPVGILDSGLSKWIVEAVRGGDIRQGSYLYAGVVGEAADATNSSSQLAVDISNATLAFSEDWPALEAISGRLTIVDDAVRADIDSAVMKGMTLSDGLVAVRQRRGESLLDLRFLSQPASADWRWWLEDSPVADQVAGLRGDWQVDGKSEVDMAITLNLETVEPEALRLRVDAEDMALASVEHDIKVDQLRGRFEYSLDDGVSGESTHMRLESAPASLAIKSPVWKPDSRQMEVRLGSTTSTQTIRRHIDLPDLVRLNGAARFDTFFSWTWSPESARYSALVRSDLTGIAFDYPRPFGKTAQRSRPSELEVSWSEDRASEEFSYRFQVGELVGGVLAGTGSAGLTDIDGRIRFGGAQADRRTAMSLARLSRTGEAMAASRRQRGIEISGYLPQLDVEEWRAFFSEAFGADDHGEIAVLTDEPLLNQRARQLIADWPAWLTSIDLTVADLQLKSQSYERFGVLALPSDDRQSLDVALDVPGLVKGAVRIPAAAAEYPTARLEYLRLPESDEEAEEDGPAFTPDDVPLGNVVIDSLDYGEQQLGSWRWIAEKRDEGVVLRDLKANVVGAKLDGRLSWLREPISAQQTTILTGELAGARFESLYKHFQGPAPMTAKSYRFKTGVVWNGSPFDFSWERLSGQISMRLKDGRFKEVSRSADLFKVFSILNTDTLTRRLKLDFSDIYEKGISYDDIEGSARIKEGVVDFESPLAIQATSSAFKLSGTMSMVTDALDMELLVVLPLTKNLPLAALLVGAPQIGGALFLIDKLLGDALSKLTSATYVLTGTLDKPDINLKQSFGGSSERE